ncbi:NAD-dependent DNA ligase LigA [endosymbiont GvMRE of Glomus versiforme]|uniref:NAD-dependent DNA ligase LigA n=1 Tax=endosymbiont GvMRE of Glomus versiforme TaxID=2039283 RepID=UPI000ED0DF84|nr:NAD-dependent DNA ligase LigA [endosymbiont GvMRE of Glomus versiforme]RHZ37295.1 DNA ligase [endosymbiont GvMRE of Glomus versiforme]
MTVVAKEISQQMQKLIQLLEKWNYEYNFLNQPTVDDKIYDQTFQELKDLEEKYNLVLPNSPTQKVGSKIKKKFHPVAHQIPMLSLESTDNYEELVRFDEKVKKKLGLNEIDYLCELKIDGLSASLHYQNGKLSKIVTRGDGWTGEDVSVNLPLIQNLPKNLPEKTKIIEIRGEIYMKKEEFQRLNNELKKRKLSLLANPRNAAAGTLRTLIPTQQRNLNFFAYQILRHDNDKVNETSNQLNCLEKLANWGFEPSPYYRICHSLEEIQKYFQEVKEKRDNLEFEIDGIVIKVNNYEYYEKLGNTNRFPRWAFAYKFPASIVLSEVKDIQVEITRSGRVSYVAQIIPVSLLGSQISKATLHNYGFIQQLNLAIGDRVVIKKAGDIIPQVVQVIKMNGQNTCWIPPTNCPSCSALLAWNQEQIYQHCPNEDCPERNIKSLALFASKQGMDIKGVSEAIIRKLYQVNLLKTPTDFYRLEQKKSELLKIEGLQKKSVNNLLNSIEQSKKKPFFCLITALGIPLLGGVKSRKLVSNYPNLGSLLQAVEKNELEPIGKLLGTETQKEITHYFQKPKNLEILKDMEKFNF